MPVLSAGGGSRCRRGMTTSPSRPSEITATFHGPQWTTAARVEARMAIDPWPTSWPMSSTGSTSPRCVKTPGRKAGAAGRRVSGPSRTTSVTSGASKA